MAPPVDLLAVKGLEKTSGAFRRRVCEIADELGLSADYLCAVMSFETGGTFSPSIENPYSHFVGLIQFGPAAAKEQGTSLGALGQMSALEQLEYVKGFYARRINELGHLHTAADHYLAVFAPAFIGKPASRIIFEAPEKAYEQNKALDRDGDGAITVGEATAPVEDIIAAAGKRPRLPVDAGDSAPPVVKPAKPVDPEPASGGAVVVGALLGLWGLSRLARAWRHR